jgi:hypothetical protein
VIVREHRGRGFQHAQAARHPEVQDQAAGFELDQQVLGPPANLDDALSREQRRQPCVHGPAQTRLAQDQRGHASAAHGAANAAARGLDLGKFRHGGL